MYSTNGGKQLRQGSSPDNSPLKGVLTTGCQPPTFCEAVSSYAAEESIVIVGGTNREDIPG